jgi:hypothetical protein
VAVVGVVLLLGVIALIPQLEVDWISSVLILVFGFFFVTVSSRICGQIGSTSNPISGMTIATLLFTSLIFLVLGRMGAGERVIAPHRRGDRLCRAAANAGNTSQDLKTGFLVGATPKWQQTGLLIGALTSALVIGWTLDFLNRAAINILPAYYPGYTVDAASIREPTPTRLRRRTARATATPSSRSKSRIDDGKTIIPAGKYLVGDDNQIHYLVNPGVGGIRQGLTRTNPGGVGGPNALSPARESLPPARPADSTTRCMSGSS